MADALDDYSSIIVTGGTGWLGRRLIAALTGGMEELGALGKGGARVRCLVPPGEPTAELCELGVEIITGDIRDGEAVAALIAGAEGALVIHLAGVIHPAARTRDFDAINRAGTAALCHAAASNVVRRMVVMSSNSPLGYNALPEDRFTEESPYNPYMGYGRSKMAMERQLREAIAISRSSRGGPEIVIARAPWFYGPGQPPRQTLFFSMIRAGRFPLIGDGANRRSMGYVDSLALGLLLCATVPRAAGNTYWLADAEPYPMADIIDTVKAVLRDDFAMKVADRSPRLPAMVSDIARLADAGIQACGLYHQKIHVLSEMNLTIACDIGKARRELGYAPLVELREGMRRSIQWCLDAGHKI